MICSKYKRRQEIALTIQYLFLRFFARIAQHNAFLATDSTAIRQQSELHWHQLGFAADGQSFSSPNLEQHIKLDAQHHQPKLSHKYNNSQ